MSVAQHSSSEGWWEKSSSSSNGTTVAQILQDVLASDGKLTREALDRCVEKISRRIDESKAHIYETVNKHYSEFVNALSFTENIQAEVDGLVSDLETIDAQARTGKLADIVNSASEQRVLAKKLSATKSAIVILQKLCRIDASLRQFDNKIECGQYDAAAEGIEFVDSLVQQLEPESENGCDPKIFSAVRADLRRKRSKLRGQLEEMWRHAVVWGNSSGADSGGQNVFQVTSTVAAPQGRVEVPLRVLTAALSHVGMWNSKMDKFADNAMKHIFTPLLDNHNQSISVKNNQKLTAIVLSHCKDSDTVANRPKGKSARALRGKGGNGHQKDANTVAAVFKSMLAAFESFASAFQSDSEGSVQAVGLRVWERLHGRVIERLLQPRLASATQRTHAEHVAAITQHTTAFEESVRTLGLVGDTHTELSQYVAGYTVHVANKQRQDLLDTARELLNADNFNTVAVRQDTERGGLFAADNDGDVQTTDSGALNESLYKLPACHVSVTAKSLVDFAYDNLAEMGCMEPEEATMVFYGVRDVFDLYRAIVPMKHEDMFSQVPQLCAVFHNDCFYIAHHLLTMGHQHRHALPEALHTAATFVDMVPAFRELGEQSFARMLGKQRQQLADTLADAKGLANTSDDARFEHVQRVIQQLLHQLSRLASVWRSVLPVQVFLRSIGSLASGVVAGVLDGVFALEDMTSVETLKLRTLFEPMLEHIPQLLGKVTTDNGGEDATAAALRYIATWGKFIDVYEALDAGIRDLTMRFKSGRSRLSAAELRGIIKAIFTNSDLRAKCLADIK
eukprot:m.579649 g.579649  ORF g.579649 m.579649 type:complete len:793 (-) comp22315_c0_seq1:579-2957(-)